MIKKNVLTVAMLGLSLITCTRSSDQVGVLFDNGHRIQFSLKDTLRLTMVQGSSLDWQIGDHRLGNNIMEGLTRYDFSHDKIEIKPGLATSWKTMDNGRKWKFQIRQNVQWSDGVPFQPQDILDGWRRTLDQKTAAPNAYFLFYVKNAHAFNAGKLPFEKVGVKISGPWEIEIELEKPLAFFPMVLTNPVTFPVRQDLIQKFGPQWVLPEHIVTLGPYRVVGNNPDRVTVLTRYENYYGAADISPRAPKNVVVYGIGDEAKMNMFQTGKLDLVPDLSPTQYRELPSGLKTIRNTLFDVNYMGFCVNKPPISNPELRRAIIYALDQREIVRAIGDGQKPLSGWVPEGMIGHSDGLTPKFSPSEAKDLLAKAGYPDPSKLRRLELAIYNPADRPIAENIQFQLKKNLGIEVEIRFQEWKMLKQRFQFDPPDLFLHGWSFDFPDPDSGLSILASYAGNNHTGWHSSLYDDKLERGASTIDTSKRQKLYAEAQALLEKDVPVFPIYASTKITLVNERISYFPANSLDIVLLKDIGLSGIK